MCASTNLESGGFLRLQASRLRPEEPPPPYCEHGSLRPVPRPLPALPQSAVAVPARCLWLAEESWLYFLASSPSCPQSPPVSLPPSLPSLIKHRGALLREVRTPPRVTEPTRLGPSPFPDLRRRPAPPVAPPSARAPHVKPSRSPLAPSAAGTRRSGAGAETAASLTFVGTMTSEVARHLRILNSVISGPETTDRCRTLSV
ncbi:lysine-rich arabinogalactan protein 18-like [Pteropus medius]|uniref:lysine-rich arabinogalactan protein 18-like n=1 Tax=Pteropus vampyrus TaxID=132908 RepID=UPI00196ACC84|nr:lysine-rich arabinogalactan protein 18-like [Pteropus giganteus]